MKGAAVALVWLICAAASVAVSCCPEPGQGRCSCHLQQGLYTANCSDLPRTGTKVEALTVLRSQDDPLELVDGQFLSARHLKYLSLRNASIYYIHKKAFYGAKNLVEIDLSFNFLEDLEPTVFQQLPHLATLVLRGNPIQVASEVPFLISNSLQHLDIGQCQIRSLPRGVFYGLKRLKYLLLDGNFLKSLEYNSLPKGLKYIDLSQNHIVNVPTEVLSTLTNLRRVGLGGNPINCSCSLLNLQDWLSGRGVIFENDVTCDLPTEYYGVSWSKVDENRICLEEARREEISDSIVYTPLFKNKLYKGNYFDNENSYLGENIQSDQPQADVHPDPESEVIFQNDETLAMGEMMRNEDDKKDIEEVEKTLEGSGKPIEKDEAEPDENDEESATVSKTEIQEEEFGTGEPPKETSSDDGNTNNQGTDDENQKLPNEKDNEKEVLQSAEELAKETNLQNVLELSSNNANEKEVSNVEDSLDQANYKPENNLGLEGGDSNKDISGATSSKSELNEEHTEGNDESDTQKGSVETFSLNENRPLEYKPISELNDNDPNSEADVIKQEGFYHVKSEKYSLNSSEPTEETTDTPVIEDTTDDEVGATDKPEVLPEEEAKHSEEEVQNVTSTTEIPLTPGTEINISSTPVIETTSEAPETVPPEISSVILSSSEPEIETTEQSEIVDLIEPFIEPESKGNSSLAAPAMKGPEEKFKQVAGAEVVMFCIAVLIICLVLYSIFKCRSSSKRPNSRTVKDIESNRGTEMQDMASLLPKPEDEQKKDLKYPTKAESSETAKLIMEQNENGSPNITPVANSEKLNDTKNSLNNNSPLNKNGRTPLIKPDGTAPTINPLGPIQRTKAKVGIIPDSIPQTPILIQKSYSNGTKRV